MENIILHTENLAAGYNNKKPVISDIDISVKRGRIVTLIGPNGTGKSTILKTISAQIPPVYGNIYINGKDMRNISSRELSRTMAVVMTEKIDPELMTCYDVISSGRYPYTGQFGILSANDKTQIDYAMKLTHTEELAGKDFSCISDGQRQRVMLARAVCQEPDILVLDEPTSFLDIRHKLELLSILKKLISEKNTGIIMSMHELALAESISDYVVCVSEGKIDKSGTPEEIFTNEYISRLYGIAPDMLDTESRRFGEYPLKLDTFSG